MSTSGGEGRDRAKVWVESAEKKKKSGDLDGAIGDYSMALEADATWAQPCLARGSLRQQLGRLDEAIEDYTRAIRIDPRYARAYAKRGVAYLAKRDYGAAENDFAKALEGAPTHARLLALRIEARLGGHRGWEALSDANALLEAHPDDVQGLYWRGLALEAVGDAAGAERDLRAAAGRGHIEARQVLRRRYGGV